MNKTVSPANGTEQISFDRESKYTVGTVTYLVMAHFDQTKEDLSVIIKRLLCSEVKKSIKNSRSLKDDVV